MGMVKRENITNDIQSVTKGVSKKMKENWAERRRTTANTIKEIYLNEKRKKRCERGGREIWWRALE